MTQASVNERDLREQICEIGRLMRQYGYIEATSGNISARLDGERILATPSGLAKGRMSPEQLIIVDMEGRKVGPESPANRDLHPTSELLMHLECYRQRADIGGVVHAHPPTAVALTVAGISLKQCFVPEAIILLGLVPTSPYATPSGTENRDSIREFVSYCDAMMLANHGSLTLGGDVWTAYLRLEVLEYLANVIYKVHQLGGAVSLPEEKVEQLLALRQKMGLAHPEDGALFRQYYEAAREAAFRT